MLYAVAVLDIHPDVNPRLRHIPRGAEVIRRIQQETDTGLVTGTGVETTTIAATQAGVSGTTTVNVTPPVLTSIMITSTTPSIAKGTSLQLTATGLFCDLTTEDLTQSVTWTSADITLATVNPTGRVTGTGVGTTIITAFQTGVRDSTTVTVTPAVLTAIVITPTTPSIAKGTSLQLTATGVFSDLSTEDFTQSVSWTSANITLATVSPSGLVTGTGAVAVANAIAFVSEAIDPISIFIGLTRRGLMGQALRFLLFGEGETGLMVYTVLLRYWDWTHEEDVRPVIYLLSD